jgi:hypothetical protein
MSSFILASYFLLLSPELVIICSPFFSLFGTYDICCAHVVNVDVLP